MVAASCWLGAWRLALPAAPSSADRSRRYRGAFPGGGLLRRRWFGVRRSGPFLNATGLVARQISPERIRPCAARGAIIRAQAVRSRRVPLRPGAERSAAGGIGAVRSRTQVSDGERTTTLPGRRSRSSVSRRWRCHSWPSVAVAFTRRERPMGSRPCGRHAGTAPRHGVGRQWGRFCVASASRRLFRLKPRGLLDVDLAISVPTAATGRHRAAIRRAKAMIARCGRRITVRPPIRRGRCARACRAPA